MIIDAPALSEPMGVLEERQPSPCRLHSTVMGVKISSHWFRILPLDIPKHESFGVPIIDRGTRRCLQAGLCFPMCSLLPFAQTDSRLVGCYSLRLSCRPARGAT